MELKTSVNFDFKKVRHKLNRILSETAKGNLDDAVKQLKSNITKQTYFKDKPIHPMTKSVRLVRGITSTNPLVSTGKLLKSIKKSGKGISINKYGEKQHEGFTFRSGWNKEGKDGFYAPRSKAKAKILYQVKGGTEVVPRPWIRYVPKKAALKTFFKAFMKELRIPMRTITVKEI